MTGPVMIRVELPAHLRNLAGVSGEVRLDIQADGRAAVTIGDALDALEADEVVKEALPGDMYRVFMHYKRDEWERYCATVTDWEVEEYLDVLP